MATLHVAIEPRERALADSIQTLTAGLAVGVGMSSLFAGLLLGPGLERLLGEGVAFIGVAALTIGAVFSAGAGFGALVGGTRKQNILVGLMFVGVTFLGLLIPLALEPIGISSDPLRAFRIGFIGACAAIAFVATAAASGLLGRRGWLARAAAVAAVTALAYVLVALLVDPMPGWHVGGGERAMLKVAALGNFAAGLVGGAFARWSFVSRRVS